MVCFRAKVWVREYTDWCESTHKQCWNIFPHKVMWTIKCRVLVNFSIKLMSLTKILAWYYSSFDQRTTNFRRNTMQSTDATLPKSLVAWSVITVNNCPVVIYRDNPLKAMSKSTEAFFWRKLKFILKLPAVGCLSVLVLDNHACNLSTTLSLGNF